MIKHQNEVPVTYLNKGQVYSISVADSAPSQTPAEPVKYRTHIRISFDEEEQRAKPAACWQLWKEGRGLNEAHNRGGKLQAVEYADPMQGAGDEHKQRQIQLEGASFDGFSVVWTANPATGVPHCTIPVRFNFLSTDFSHSKGVKGIPVRLCAKTEIISPDENSGSSAGAEVSYCKVKLFRDHGAERKLSNDVVHVKKTIEKIKQQMAQAEAGGSVGKRKRSCGSTAFDGDRPAKVAKSQRRWSMDSHDVGSGKMSLEDDLQTRLETMQDMFTSARPMSAFNLRGDDLDDPVLHPVHLPGETKVEQAGRFQDTASATSTLSPGSSVGNSPRHAQFPRFGCDSGYHGSLRSSMEHEGALDRFAPKPARVTKLNTDGFIEAVDVDTTYQPPREQLPKPGE